MDFFQAQDHAIRRTKLLVFYYALAVALIICAVYLAVTAGFVFYHSQDIHRAAPPLFGVPLWDTTRFIATLAGVVLLVGTGSLVRVLALRGGGAVVATSLGGQLVDRDTRDPRKRQLLNIVEEMAIASGVPVPQVYILPAETSINAFAAGWGMDDAAIAVSAGALEHLSRDELQGVIAHEYSHVLYGDCRMNIRLMGLLFGIMMLTLFARLLGHLLRGASRSTGGRTVVVRGGGGRRGGGKGGGAGPLILAVLLVIVLVTLIGFIGTFFARLIQAAISRQREFLADAAAVQFTRNPTGISGALKKIAAKVDHGVLQHPSASEAAHMFFADGLKRSFSSVFATHPPLRERIQKIEPGWDGELDETALRRPVTRVAGGQPAGARPAAGPAGMEKIGGMAVLGAIGTLGSQHLQAAQRIRARIPDALDEHTRTPDGARQVVVALVMADNRQDDDAQWKLVEAAFSGDGAARIRESLEAVRAMPRESWIGLLEMASTTLAQSAVTGRDAFFKLLDELIFSDQQGTLYEVCMRRLLRERLSRGMRSPGSADSVSYMTLPDELAVALGALLSAVAREAGQPADPAQSVERAVSGLYLLKGKVAYQQSGADLDAAIDAARQAAFAIRAQFLRAVVACINEDGQLTAAEVEALRLLSLCLECPMPPLG